MEDEEYYDDYFEGEEGYSLTAHGFKELMSILTQTLDYGFDYDLVFALEMSEEALAERIRLAHFANEMKLIDMFGEEKEDCFQIALVFLLKGMNQTKALTGVPCEEIIRSFA